MRVNDDPEQGLARCRVLVVEDEFFLADDMARALNERGAVVLGPAASLKRAYALLEEGNADLAVLDVNLKGGLVFPFAEELRRRGIPFVFATGYGAAMIPPTFADVPRWEKPFPVDGLVRSLKGLGSCVD